LSALQGSALHGHQTKGIERYIPNLVSQTLWVGNIKGVMCLEDSMLTRSDKQLSGCSYNLKGKVFMPAVHALYV